MNVVTVLVSGKFNVLHPGHLRLLRFAKESGTRLVVAVESDRLADASAHVPEHLRLEGVQSISLVDEAFIFDEPIASLISRLHPDVVVKGKEHETHFNPEQVVLEKCGGKLLFSSGETGFSSLDLIRKEFENIDHGSIGLPMDYMARHAISLGRLHDLIAQFGRLKIFVVGDLIVDEYVTCQPLGMSQEDPTIVVTPVDSKRYLGGAGIVAAHASGLGAEVRFLTISGDDLTRDFALAGLKSAGVVSRMLVDGSRPTTLKQRYRCQGKSLLRVSHLHQSDISLELQNQLFQEIEQTTDGVNLLVFSDFNYGCLPQSLVDRVIHLAKQRGVILAADSQSSSQVGDISRFSGMDIITPTEREARISTRNRGAGLVVLAEQLRQQACARNVLLKLCEEGVLVQAENVVGNDWLTDRISALNSVAKDVAGAGDSLLIASAMTLACGGTIWEAACLGSLAAAVQVGQIGNIPLFASDLTEQLMR